MLVAGVSAAHVDPVLAAAWAAAVHQAIREIGGQVTGRVVPPGCGRNYYSVRVRMSDGGRVRFLLNAGARIVAAVDDTARPRSPRRFETFDDRTCLRWPD
jgi:hypothetical protein